MNIKKMTAILVAATVGIWIIYDIYAFQAGGTEGTISWFVFELSYKYPAIVFAFGFVCGHLFWQMKPKAKLKGE